MFPVRRKSHEDLCRLVRFWNHRHHCSPILDVRSVKIDPSIPGWSTRAKLVNIANAAKIAETLRPNPRILEIGVFAGRSLYHWAANAPSAEVVALDPGIGFNLTTLQQNDPETLGWMDGDFDKWGMWDTDIEDVRKNVIAQHGLTNVALHRTPSSKYLRKNKEPFDIIYIDGDHSTAQVYADIAMSRLVLKEGGIICGDDYNGLNTVRQGLLNFKREAELKVTVFNGMDMWVIHSGDEIDFWFPEVVDNSENHR